MSGVERHSYFDNQLNAQLAESIGKEKRWVGLEAGGQAWAWLNARGPHMQACACMPPANRSPGHPNARSLHPPSVLCVRTSTAPTHAPCAQRSSDTHAHDTHVHAP